MKLWSSKESLSLLMPVSWGHCIFGVILTLIPGFIFFWPCWVASTWSSYLKGKFPTFLYPVSMMISFLAVRGSSTLCWGPLGVSASSPVQESCPPPVHPSEHRLKVRVSRVWRRLPGFLLSLLRSLKIGSFCADSAVCFKRCFFFAFSVLFST